MKKRLLSTLLAYCLLLTLLPAWASASEGAVRPSVTPDGDYWENMTRQEALDMLKAVKAGTETRNMIFVYYKYTTDTNSTGLYNSAMGDKTFIYVYADMGKGAKQEGGTLKGEPDFEALFPNMTTVEQAGLVYNADSKQYHAESASQLPAAGYLSALKYYMRSDTSVGLGVPTSTPPSGSSDPGPGGDNPPTPPGEDDGKNNLSAFRQSISPEAWAVLRLTNIHRMGECPYRTGTREPLSVFAELQKSADERADEIRQKYDPGHKRLDGRSWITIYPEVGINGYQYAAENLASGQKNSAAAFFAWYNSTMHHRNMDDQRAVHMGAGYAASNNWAENFVTNNCSFRELKLSRTTINGQAGVDLETLLLYADIEVSARCLTHGTSILPLIAAMCSGDYDPNCDKDQTLTVKYQTQTTTLTIKAAGSSDVHTHELVETTTDATCTEDGLNIKTCKTCGEIQTTVTNKAAGHQYVNGVCTGCGKNLKAVVESDVLDYTSSEFPLVETIKTWDAKKAEEYVQAELNQAKTDNKYPSGFEYKVQPAGAEEAEYFKKPVDGNAANPNGEDGYFRYRITITDPNQTTTPDTPTSRRARAGTTEGQDGVLTLNLPAVPYDGGTTTPPAPPTPPSPPSHTHSWNSGKVTKEPTCTETGIRTISCYGCSATKTETIAALGHNWDDGKATTPAGCVTDGVLTYTCANCGETKTEVIPASGQHDWDDGEVTTPADCGTDGVKTYTCANCGETKTEEIPATGEHEWDAGSFSGDCAEGGVKTYECTVCGETKTETVPAGEHSWDGGKLSSGSCTEGGTQIYTCTVCGKTRTEDLPADGHTWDDGAVTTEPSCTESGVKTFTCDKCGETRTEEIPALGHKRDGGTVTKAASCTENGERVFACTVCGEKLSSEIIPATGHRFAGNDADGYTCPDCGEKIGPELRNPYEEIQKELDKSKDTVTVTGTDGKTEIILEQKVQVLPAGAVADKTNTNAVKAAVQAYLERTLQNIINRVSDPAWRIVSKVEVVRIEPGAYKEEPGAWYVCQVTLSRTAVRAADVLKTEEIWVFVSDKRVNTSEETYYISIPKSDGGEIIPNTRYAAYGERVTLSAHPGKGYELDGITVKDVRGRELSVRELNGNQYAFYMPSCKVTVEAAFIKAGAGDAPASPDDTIPGTSHTSSDPDDEPFTGLGTPGISGIVLNPAAMPFTDVPAGSWYYNGVEYMWKHYLMSGVSDTQFAPAATTSRAMIWTVMARMNNVRTDVNPGSTWYERGMLWGMEKGLTDGTNPMGDITREQLAAMLWRNAGRPDGSNADLSRFSDEASISSYARGAVQWAVTVGILNGADGKLNPKGTATRAEVAVMIMRYSEKAA